METENKNRPEGIKQSIIYLSCAIFLAGIIAGIAMLGMTFGGMSAQILLAPVNLLMTFPANLIAIAVIIVSAMLFYYTGKNRKVWFLPLVASALPAIVWLISCMVIIRLVSRR